MYLTCHVTSYEQNIDGLWGFPGGSSLRYVTILSSLVTISTVRVEI